MSLSDALSAAKATRDGTLLIAAMPFAQTLGMRLELDQQEPLFFLPTSPRLIGNPRLPAMHGGAMAGFLQCAAMVHLLWTNGSVGLPKLVDFRIDYLRSAKVLDTWAAVRPLRVGGRVANVRVEAWQESPERIVAVGSGNFLLSG